MLICKNDHTKLCVACVVEHPGHTMLTFQQYAQEIIDRVDDQLQNKYDPIEKFKSLIHTMVQVRENSDAHLESEKARLDQFSKEAHAIVDEMHKKHLKKLEDRASKVQFLINGQIQIVDQKMLKLQKLRDSDQLHQVRQIYEYQDFISVIDTYQNITGYGEETKGGDESNVVEEEQKDPQPEEEKKEAKPEEEKKVAKAEDSVNMQEVIQRTKDKIEKAQEESEFRFVREDSLLSSMKALLDSNSWVEISRLPELYYVPEKKTELHTFDVTTRRARKFDLQQEMKIPLFFSVARTRSGRVFGFGGKEIVSKKITNRCFEIEIFTRNPHAITTKYVSSMWERRSRASICSNS